MNFLYPGFLFGLLLISIPILIHLFNFRKATKKSFSNVAFLKEVQVRSHKQSRIKHWLILLCRVLAVTAIVLAFAQPFIPVSETIKSSGRTLIYLDNTFSMNLESGENSFLNTSKDFISELSEFFPEGSEYLFWTSDNTSSVPKLKSSIQNQLTETDWSYSATTAGEVIEKASKQYKSLEDLQVYVFSDFQHTEIEKLSEAMSDSSIQWNLVPYEKEEYSNLYVDSVWMDNPLVLVNESSAIHFRIKNSGNEFKKVKATLSIDGQTLGKIQEQVEAGSYLDVSYNVVLETAGNHTGKLEIEDFPIYMDNEFFFSINIPEKYAVALITDNEKPLVDQVYASEENFVVNTFATGNYDYSYIEQSDLLVLDMSSAISASFQEYVFSKYTGDVVFLPGNSAVSPGRVRLQAHTDTSMVGIDLPEKENYFLSGIFSTYRSDITLPAVEIEYDIRAAETLIPFENGLPFLAVNNDLESGRSFYYFASSLETLKESFLRSAFSIPVFYKCLLLSKNINNPEYYRLGNSTVKVELTDSSALGKKIELQSLDSSLSVPYQSVQGRSVLLSLSGLEQPGSYGLLVEGNEDALKSIAVNVPKKESQLQFANISQLTETLQSYKNVTFFGLEGKTPGEFFAEQEQGVPLWKYFIIFAIIFLLAEMAIIKWYKE